MTPGSYNLDIYRGDTSRWQFKLWIDNARTQPADLTGVIAEATVRDKAVNGSYQILLMCVVTLPNIIDMTMTSYNSQECPTVGVWDLQLTYPSGDIITVLKGSCIVTHDVTYSNPPVQLTRVK